MENQPPTSSASSWLNRRPGALDERDTEITKLKERLGFYESFDQIIQDNVARAGELLRHAASMKESAEETLSTAKQEMEESRVAERRDFRSLLSGLLDDVTSMQVQVERLARKVADALDEIESTLPAGVDLDRLPTDLPDPMPALAADTGGEHEQWNAAALDPTADEIAPAETLDTEAAAMGTAAAPLAEEHSEIEADIAAAEATDIVDAAEYLTATATELDAGAGEMTEESAASAEVSTIEEPEQFELNSSTEAEPVVEDTGENVSSLGEPIDEVEAAQSDDSTAGAFDSDELAASSSGFPEAPDPAVAGEHVAVSEPEPAIPGEPAPAIAAGAPIETPAQDRSDIRPFPIGGLGATNPRGATGELRSHEPARYAAPTMVALGTRGVGTVVLVHGVPRATTALSLKRFLESLPHVASVEPREYAEGVLRLHVTAQRPVQIEDLRGWSDGAGFEPVHLKEDLVEVRLPH